MPRRWEGEVGERAQGGHGRGQLADVVEVEVDAPERPCPGTRSPASVGSTSQPIGGEDVAQRVAGLGGEPRPVPHRDLAAADARPARGRVRRWTGPARWCGRGRDRARCDRPAVRRRSRRPRRRARAACATVISMWGSDGTGLPSWRTSTPSSNRARGQQQRRDELRGGRGVHHDRAAAAPCPVPWTVNGRPAPSTSTPRARSASSTSPTGRCRMCGSPSKSTTPVARPATGGRKRITVPARPQSMRAGPESGPGVIAHVRRRDLDVAPEAPQRRQHQRGVAGHQRTAYDAGAVGQRGQHQRAVGLRLAAGQRYDRRHRVGRARRRPGVGERRRRVRHPRSVARLVRRSARRRASPHAAPSRPGGRPRGARPSRRDGRARRRRASPRCRRRR